MIFHKRQERLAHREKKAIISVRWQQDHTVGNKGDGGGVLNGRNSVNDYRSIIRNMTCM